MSDTNTPNADPDPSADPNPPPPDNVEINGGGYKKLWILVAGFGGLAILIIALLLPALGQRGGYDRPLKNTTQVRGIVQGMIAFASGNKDKMPGLNSKSHIIYDDGNMFTSDTGASGHGATVEARFWIMLDANLFDGNYAISPSETKTVWTTGSVTSDNYSYAMLNIHDGAANPSSEEDKVRPNQSGRVREWKQSINTQAVLVADRARIPGGRIGDNYDKIYSIHTSQDDASWAGSVGRGDGSASFENEDGMDTKYGSGSPIEYDRLFSRDQDSNPDIDVLDDPAASWDDTANALLGYTSVGYEDPDIASD